MTRIPPTIDLLPDGTFRTPPPGATFRASPPGGAFRTPPPGVPFATKLALGSMLVAVVGGMLAVAALAFWIVSMLLPAIIVAGAVAWGALKWRRWQLLRGQRELRPGQPGFFRQ